MLVFQIIDQTLERLDSFHVVGNSQNYLKAHFVFSEDWEGFTRTVVFTGRDGKSYSTMLDDSNTCVVPWEVLTRDRFYIAVRGDMGGDLLTTNQVTILVTASGIISGQTPEAPTPDVYTEILNRLNAIPPVPANDGKTYGLKNGQWVEIAGTQIDPGQTTAVLGKSVLGKAKLGEGEV